VEQHLGRPYGRKSQRAAPAADAAGDEIAAGEATLLRKLRTRSLSSVKRDVLAACEVDEGHGKRSSPDSSATGISTTRVWPISSCTPASNAEPGRSALARSLAQRGIARDVIDDALAALPDDEFCAGARVRTHESARHARAGA
jgi:regulatory protein